MVKVDQKRLDYIVADAVQGFTKYIGYEPVHIEAGRFVSRIRLKKHHLQQDGVAHAGVIAAMADHTAGYAAFTLVPADVRILTVEFKINYLSLARGEFLECRSHVLKPGKQILVTESEIYAIQGKKESLVAKAILTMAAVPQSKVRQKLRQKLKKG